MATIFGRCERQARMSWLGVVGLLAIYLAIQNAHWWLWVAESAFLGIRAPAEPILGVVSVFFAIAPFVAAAMTSRACRRRTQDSVRSLTWASIAGAVAAIGAGVVSLVLTFPF